MVTRRRIRVAVCGALAAVAVTAVGVAIAGADVPCAPRSTTQAFLRVGDPNHYFLAPGGDFEFSEDESDPDQIWTRGSGRRLSRHDRAWDNDPWAHGGHGGDRALRVTRWSTARSPRFCVASDEESIRFVAQSDRGESLMVSVRVESDRGTQTVVHEIEAPVQDEWFVIPALPLPNVRDSKGEQWVTIALTAGNQDRWLVDNVMIDPWRTW